MKIKKQIEVQAKEAEMRLAVMDRDKEYLRSADVKKLFSISDSTLKNLRTSGDLPCYKLGGIYLYKRAEIEACVIRLAANG